MVAQFWEPALGRKKQKDEEEEGKDKKEEKEGEGQGREGGLQVLGQHGLWRIG